MASLRKLKALAKRALAKYIRAVKYGSAMDAIETLQAYSNAERIVSERVFKTDKSRKDNNSENFIDRKVREKMALIRKG